MRKMKKWLALMVAGMMTVGLMGCSGSSDEGKKESGSDKADMKAAVVFGLGGLGDQSYNDLAYEGMERWNCRVWLSVSRYAVYRFTRISSGYV